MSELLHQMRDLTLTLSGSVGSIPSTFISASDIRDSKHSDSNTMHSTPASNLKLSEAIRDIHHDGSPSISGKISSSKSCSSGLTMTTSTGTTLIPVHSNSTNMAPFDISPNSTQFFEVLYVGKIKVSHKRVPFTFIDDALPKFKAYDTQKMKTQTQPAATVCYPKNFKFSIVILFLLQQVINYQDEPEHKPHGNYLKEEHSDKDIEVSTFTDQLKAEEKELYVRSNDEMVGQFEEKIINTRISEENKENSFPLNKKILLRGQSQVVLPVQFE